MDSLTRSLAQQLVNSLDSPSKEPSYSQIFLACLVCKNLADLCETGRAILEQANLDHTYNFPNSDEIELIRLILGEFYADDMFILDEELGNLPNWEFIKKFDKFRALGAYRIYLTIYRGLINNPLGPQIQQAVKTKNVEFFVKNFDSIFAKFPKRFEKSLDKFKNFLQSSFVKEDDQERIWEFFDFLLDLFLSERSHLEQLSQLEASSSVNKFSNVSSQM